MTKKNTTDAKARFMQITLGGLGNKALRWAKDGETIIVSEVLVGIGRSLAEADWDIPDWATEKECMILVDARSEQMPMLVTQKSLFRFFGSEIQRYISSGAQIVPEDGYDRLILEGEPFEMHRLSRDVNAGQFAGFEIRTEAV